MLYVDAKSVERNEAYESFSATCQLEAPFRRQRPLNPRIELCRHVHGARESFKASLDDMMRVFAARHVDVQVHAELIGEGGKKFVRQVRGEVTDAARADLDVIK